MYEYEIQQARSAELLRKAEHERLVREAVRTRRAARRAAQERTAGTESHTDRPRRRWSTRAA
ncbi:MULTISPECIES: hypothetical protein [Streptomyces]|jgi:hypothetical protein|uniref:Uncharacterized protein n=2 Tax=Streptomyces TaxID=1883 RepID=A0A2U9P986_STRAS|nr:hypothetical protein [Streptomyces actuosus]AWT45651.1 hypothetical protein DMT42_27420 [Streptomyces actuosus]MBM4822281.1 hypothetical protein [Streptomyces actuosus]